MSNHAFDPARPAGTRAHAPWVSLPRREEPWLWSLVDHAADSSSGQAATELRLSLNGVIEFGDQVATIGLPMLVLPAEELCALIAFAQAHESVHGPLAYRLSRGERAALNAAAEAGSAHIAAGAFHRAALVVVAWPMFAERWLAARSWTHCPVEVLAGFCQMLEANFERLSGELELELDRPTWLRRSWQRRIKALHANPRRESGVRDERPTFQTMGQLPRWEDALVGASSHQRRSWEEVVAHGWPNLYYASCDDWNELLVASGALPEVTLASALHRLAAPDWETVVTRISRLARPILPGEPQEQARHISRELVTGTLLGQGLARVRLNWATDNDLIEWLGDRAWCVSEMVAETPGNAKATRALLHQLGERGVDVHQPPGAALPVGMARVG